MQLFINFSFINTLPQKTLYPLQIDIRRFLFITTKPEGERTRALSLWKVDMIWEMEYMMETIMLLHYHGRYEQLMGNVLLLLSVNTLSLNVVFRNEHGLTHPHP